MKNFPQSNKLSVFSPSDIKRIRQQLVNRFCNGRDLLVELDKFTALARQLFNAKKRQINGSEVNSTKQKLSGQKENDEEMLQESDDEHKGNSLDMVGKLIRDGSEQFEVMVNSNDEQDVCHRMRNLTALTSAGQKHLPITVEDNPKKDKSIRKMEKTKRRLTGSRVVQEMREYIEEKEDEQRPELVRDWKTNDCFSGNSKWEENRRLYEESHFVRLSQTRADRKAAQKNRQNQRHGNELDRLLNFDYYMPSLEGSKSSLRGSSNKHDGANRKRQLKSKVCGVDGREGTGPVEKRIRRCSSFSRRNRGKPKRNSK